MYNNVDLMKAHEDFQALSEKNQADFLFIVENKAKIKAMIEEIQLDEELYKTYKKLSVLDDKAKAHAKAKENSDNLKELLKMSGVKSVAELIKQYKNK